MPTRDELDAVQSRIEDLTGQRFWAQGEFLRPVVGGAPEAGTPWLELEFEDRREAIYVNTDWRGFSLEDQTDVTDRVAGGDPPEHWMEGIRVSDRPEQTRALRVETEEERRIADRPPSGQSRFRTVLTLQVPLPQPLRDEPERGHER